MDGMATPSRLKILWPAMVALVVSSAFAGWRLAQGGWDPVALAEVGGLYARGDIRGSPGYDGQFAYFIALDPAPTRVAGLDVPAYRYQRILYPLLARALAFGQAQAIPWALLAVNLAAHFAGTWAVAAFLDHLGVWPGYALIYGLWVGLVSGVGLDLNEPLAFALIAGGWLARQRGRSSLGALLLGLSLFAKETSLLFWGAALTADCVAAAGWRRWTGLAAGGVAFAGWQAWLWCTFGQLGLGSGGAMATPFEWIPFMGFWRIGTASLAALGLFILIFGPTLLLPTVWGVGASVAAIWKGDRRAEAWALLLNAAAVVFLPHSTFREPLGLVRFASGLILAVVCFAAVRGLRRPMNYGLFWVVMLAMLLRA
jgi:hypothetical protein